MTECARRTSIVAISHTTITAAFAAVFQLTRLAVLAVFVTHSHTEAKGTPFTVPFLDALVFATLPCAQTTPFFSAQNTTCELFVFAVTAFLAVLSTYRHTLPGLARTTRSAASLFLTERAHRAVSVFFDHTATGLFVERALAPVLAVAALLAVFLFFGDAGVVLAVE